ncbi:hypothetical protein MIDIC_210001 [Alphaproteobacteria bacterium]
MNDFRQKNRQNSKENFQKIFADNFFAFIEKMKILFLFEKL